MLISDYSSFDTSEFSFLSFLDSMNSAWRRDLGFFDILQMFKEMKKKKMWSWKWWFMSVAGMIKLVQILIRMQFGTYEMSESFGREYPAYYERIMP